MAAVSGFLYLMGKRPGTGGFSGTAWSQAVKLAFFGYVEFIPFWGDCNGTLRLTAEACDDDTGTNPVEVPFVYQKVEPHVATLPFQEAAEVVTEQKVDLAYVIAVSQAELLRSGKSHVRLKAQEQVAGPITGGILVRVSSGRYS